MHTERSTRAAKLVDRGGARFTHATLIVSQLENLVVETQAVRQETEGERPDVAVRRCWRFAVETEQLARAILRHLQAHGATA